MLQGDPVDAIDAINSYRTAHGLPSIPGSVSPVAQQCAVSNGNDCPQSWSEGPVSSLSAKEAVSQLSGIPSGGNILDDAKSFTIGWAYSGSGYYISMVTKT